MKKKKINIIFIIFFASTLLISSYLLINKYLKEDQIKEELNIIKEVVEQTEINTEYQNIIEINKLKEKFNNKDIVGILTISNIVTTPIVQTNNNTYYLKYSISHKKGNGGAVFMDFRTDIGDKQINMYGHNNTRYYRPFKELENYLDKDFYKNNKYIEFKVQGKTYKYEIISVYKDKKSDDNEHYQFNQKNAVQWQNHYNTLTNKSIYEKNTLTSEDNILVLQTCLFGKDRNKFLVIIAKQIN